MKKLLFLLVVLVPVLVLFKVSLVSAAVFTDVQENNEYYIAVEYLAEKGVLEGYFDGTYGVEQVVNRAEFMKILLESKRGVNFDGEKYYGNCFSDVTDQWFAKYVCYAADEGWVKGYFDGSFRPEQPVNKVEAIKMVVNVFSLDRGHLDEVVVTEKAFKDTETNEWYAPFLYEAKRLNILEVADSNDNYYPGAEMKRGLVAEYVFRSLVVQENESPHSLDVYYDYDLSSRKRFLYGHNMERLIPEDEFVYTDEIINPFDGKKYMIRKDKVDICFLNGGAYVCDLVVDEGDYKRTIADLFFRELSQDTVRRGEVGVRILMGAELIGFESVDDLLISYRVIDHGIRIESVCRYNIVSDELVEIMRYEEDWVSEWSEGKYSGSSVNYWIVKGDKILLLVNVESSDSPEGIDQGVYLVEGDKVEALPFLLESPYEVEFDVLENYDRDEVFFMVNSERVIYDFENEEFFYGK